MLVMMIPVGVVNQVRDVDERAIARGAARPRKSGAKPRVASSQPDRATHCRIQITKPEKTT